MSGQDHNLSLSSPMHTADFDQRVARAVESFLYDLDYMLLEEQHLRPRFKVPLVRPLTVCN